MALLHSIAFSYIQRNGSTPSKSLVRAILNLQKHDDVIIRRPDKGNSVVVMNKAKYMELLRKVSVNKTDKFIPISLERPKTRGCPPKYYHLLQKEIIVASTIRKMLPTACTHKAQHL